MEKPDSRYSKGTIEHLQQPEGGRNLEQYAAHLMFNKQELEGKDVLDLGAGPELKFARDLKEAGINARVVSLSPDFSKKKYAARASGKIPDASILAGIGQKLPFADTTFDRVFAFHVDEHLSSSRAFFSMIEEMARILRPGGEARFGPIVDIPSEWRGYEEILANQQLMEKLQSHNVEIKKELVPESIIPKQKIKDSYANAFYEPSYILIFKKKAAA